MLSHQSAVSKEKERTGCRPRHNVFLPGVICCSLQPLLLQNYQARFSTLLFAEELQMELEMRQFDMERVGHWILYYSFCLKISKDLNIYI